MKIGPEPRAKLHLIKLKGIRQSQQQAEPGKQETAHGGKVLPCAGYSAGRAVPACFADDTANKRNKPREWLPELRKKFSK